MAKRATAGEKLLWIKRALYSVTLNGLDPDLHTLADVLALLYGLPLS